MDTSLKTPLTDALIPQAVTSYYTAAILERKAARFDAARVCFERGLTAGEMYNTEFQDAKKDLSDGFERAIDRVEDTFRDANRKAFDCGAYREELWAVTSGCFQINHAPGRVKRIAKLAKHFPDIKALGEVWAEVVQFNDAINILKPHIIKGRKPAENPTQIDLTNMGTCAICQAMYKLTGAKKMVHHGFEISDGTGVYFGERRGQCFGTFHAPYELSCEANQAMIQRLVPQIERVAEHLARLQAGTIEKLLRRVEVRDRNARGGYRTEVKEFVKGGEGWEKALRAEIAEDMTQLSSLRSALERNEQLVAHWEAKPLPERGIR